MESLRESVTVRVPASTSNCGAGFDTLGLALALHNRVTLRPSAGPGHEPDRPADRRAQGMVAAAAAAFFAAAELAPSGFVYRIEGEVPPARGLGSSVTVIAGVLGGLNALRGAGFTREDLVRIATGIEGHPDNAAAGILGGFCVARSDPQTGAYRDAVRIEIAPELAFVVASPDLELLTKESRGELPTVLPFFDAVRSVNSAAYFVAAFAAGDFQKLRHAGGDFLHEPYRLPSIPGGRESIAAGIAAGAYAGWLSGSGSSVLCVTARSGAAEVERAMAEAFAQTGARPECRVLAGENTGLRVE
ncbi:MAG: homoserine kinase [Opitutaceae bacterium]